MELFHVYLRQKKIGRHVATRIIQHRFRHFIAWKKEKERYDLLNVSFTALKKYHRLSSKTYWRALDLESLSRERLEKAAMYLDLPRIGKRSQIIERIENWRNKETIWAEISASAAAKGRDLSDKNIGQVFVYGAEDHFPVEIQWFCGKKVTKLAAGSDSDSLYAINSDFGVAWLCVSASQGAISDPPIALDVFDGERIQDICISTTDGVARTSEGFLFTWGSNATSRPCRVSPSPFGHAIDISVGKHYVVAVYGHKGGEVNEVVSWGKYSHPLSGAYGQQTPPTTSSCMALHSVKGLREHHITKVACGAMHALAISHDGKLFSWGCSDGGRLGHGRSAVEQSEARTGPRQIAGLLESSLVVMIACGTWHSACIAIKTGDRGHGRVFTWGTGVFGQLGLGPERVISNEPSLVALRCGEHIEDIDQLACGMYHTAVLTGRNALFTWGSRSKKHAANSFVPRDIQLKALIKSRKVSSLTCGRTFTAFSVRFASGDEHKKTSNSSEDKVCDGKKPPDDMERQEGAIDDEEVDEERKLYLFLHPKCRVCSQCDGFRPSIDHLSFCRQCFHEKKLHGKRANAVSDHKAILTELRVEENGTKTDTIQTAGIAIQALVRRFLARQKLYSLLMERYWKIIDPKTQSPYFYDRLNKTSSWHKPILLRSRDLPIERFDI